MAEPVRLELSGDEALVLFEFLTRSGESGTLTLQDQAEERALWNLQCLLERELADIFDPNYQALLEAARDRLRDPVE